MAKLHKMVEEDLKKMLQETSHVLVVEDFKHVLALNELAWRYTDPMAEPEGDILACPVRVGNLMLWPLTLGAARWIQERPAVWFEKKPILFNLAIGFALSHSREPHVLWEIADRRRALKAVKMFWRRCGCPLAELERAMVRLFPDPEPELKEPPKEGEEELVGANAQATRYGTIIAALCQEYGQSPHHWLWEVSHEQCMEMLYDKERRIKAEWQQAKKACKAGEGPPMPGTIIDRLQAYRKYRNTLSKQWDEE